MTFANPESPPRRSRGDFRLTGWHVLGILSAFFGVMVAVNIVFVTAALKTHSGEARYAYMRGLQFNEVLARERARSALGWTMRLELERPADAPAALSVVLTDRAGAPVRGALVSAVVGRPATQAQDVTLVFPETAPGIYRTPTPMLGPGAWRFSATVSRPGAPDFTAETRLSLH